MVTSSSVYGGKRLDDEISFPSGTLDQKGSPSNSGSRNPLNAMLNPMPSSQNITTTDAFRKALTAPTMAKNIQRSTPSNSAEILATDVMSILEEVPKEIFARTVAKRNDATTMDKTLESLQNSIRCTKDHEIKANLYLQCGIILKGKGLLQEAMNSFHQGLVLKETSPQLKCVITNTYIIAYTEYCAKTTDHLKAFYANDLGNFLIASDQIIEAIKIYLEEALVTEEASDEIKAQLSYNLRIALKSNLQEAIGIFQQGLLFHKASNQTKALLCSLLGKILYENNQQEEAICTLRKGFFSKMYLQIKKLYYA